MTGESTNNSLSIETKTNEIGSDMPSVGSDTHGAEFLTENQRLFQSKQFQWKSGSTEGKLAP